MYESRAQSAKGGIPFYACILLVFPPAKAKHFRMQWEGKLDLRARFWNDQSAAIVAEHYGRRRPDA
jgi:hypothetical protein